MRYQLVHDGEVIRNAEGGIDGRVEVANAEPNDEGQPLSWFASAKIELDPDEDRVTVHITTYGRTTPLALTIQRVTRTGRDTSQLTMTLPDDYPRLADGGFVVG